MFIVADLVSLIEIYHSAPRPAEMMLGEASSPFCIPVAGQC